MACLYVPVGIVFAAFCPGRQTKFLSRRTTAKKRKKEKHLTRTPENPEFSSLESCVNFVETSRGFWLLINRLDKLFSKTLFLSCFWDFETCFVTIVLLQVESSPYYQGLSGVWCFQDRSWSPWLPSGSASVLTLTVHCYCFHNFISSRPCRLQNSRVFFLKIGFAKIVAVSQSTRTSLKIPPIAWSDSQTF